MKFLIVLLALVAAAAAQFNQGRFFNNAPQAGQSFPSNRRAFIRFDDDFDDFFDDDDDDDDSLEDLYEDLYDDDADDRAEARAALTRLRASGAITGNAFRNNRFITNRRNNAFRSTGFTNRGFVNRFSNNNNNRAASTINNRFNTARPNTGFSSTFTPTPTPTPAPTPSRFRNPFTKNNINTFNQPFRSSPTKRPFTSNTKFNSNSLNSIPSRSNSKTTAASPFKSLPSGFNWPGGNGYFFSMSTNGAKPVTYFIRYDD